MKPAASLAAFAAVLAAALGIGAAAGSALGPIDVGGGDHVAAGHDAGGSDGAGVPAGLQVAERGYRIITAATTIEGGTFAFTIAGSTGGTLRAFDEVHERRMHLIVASRDLQTFIHVHPTMAEDGTWLVELPVLAAGSYRAFADFKPAGEKPLTLGADVVVPGPVGAPRELAPSRSTTVDGYRVDLVGDIATGSESAVELRVTKDGASVTLDPYLGARGHLVALRAGDLAYLHVHPTKARGAAVPFAVEIPSAGTYALFFDFSHGGEVRTAAFVVAVEPAPITATPVEDDGHADH